MSGAAAGAAGGIGSLASMIPGFGGASSTVPGTAANGGWSTTTTAAPQLGDALKKLMPQQGQQQQQQQAPQQAPQQAAPNLARPVDVSQLLSIMKNRGQLGL